MKNTDSKSVLWDFSEEKIASLPKDFIVQRTLTYGTIRLIVKAINEDGLGFVKSVFENIKPTAFSRKKYLYLKNYLLV